MEQLLTRLLAEMGLGSMVAQPVRVYGGYLHRMYRVETEQGVWAVKHLNPGIMARPEAKENFARAEVLEMRLEKAKLPIVPAFSHAGRKMQECGGNFFYVFPWAEGKVLPWENITAEHCRIMGDLLAQVHGLDLRAEPWTREPVNVDWESLIIRAQKDCPALGEQLAQDRVLLETAQTAFNSALEHLPPMRCISDADMDCKNVLWQNDRPLVIDLECLDWGHPLWDMFQLALSWAGGTMCSLDEGKLSAFIGAYASRFGRMDMMLADLYGSGFSWMEWLEYNIRRALGEENADAEARALGEREALATLERIRHHAQNRDLIIRAVRRV